MTGHRIKLPGFRIDKKTGKPVKDLKRLDVSTRIKQANSKKVRAKR